MMMIMHSCFKQIPLHPSHNYQHIRSNVPRVILPVVLPVRIVLVFIVLLVIVIVDVGIRFDNNYYPPVRLLLLLLRLLLLLPVTVIQSYEFRHGRHLQSYGKYQNRSRRLPEVVVHRSIRIRLYTRPSRLLNSYNHHHHFHHPHTP